MSALAHNNFAARSFTGRAAHGGDMATKAVTLARKNGNSADVLLPHTSADLVGYERDGSEVKNTREALDELYRNSGAQPDMDDIKKILTPSRLTLTGPNPLSSAAFGGGTIYFQNTESAEGELSPNRLDIDTVNGSLNSENDNFILRIRRHKNGKILSGLDFYISQGFDYVFPEGNTSFRRYPIGYAYMMGNNSIPTNGLHIGTVFPIDTRTDFTIPPIGTWEVFGIKFNSSNIVESETIGVWGGGNIVSVKNNSRLLGYARRIQ